MKSVLTLIFLVLGLATAGPLVADKTAGEVVDDSWLYTKVKAAMFGHGTAGVNVEVFHGVVQLAGFLTGEGNKKNLLEAANGVEGVTRVSDQLHIVEGDRSAGTVLDDNTVTARVKAALLDQEMGGINVEVNRGNVLLSGFVDSDEVADKAVGIAKALEGVNGVINGMDIKS